MFWTLTHQVHDICWVATKAPTNSIWQNGEICQALFTEAFTSFCQAYDGTMGSTLPRHWCLLPAHVSENCTFFPSCAPVCPRVCLLDVSRPLGLTLRPSAPVCGCHRDSLRRWRLAIAQEAAHVVFFCVYSIVLFESRRAMCLVVSDSLRGRSLHAMLTYEGPASLVNLFFTHSSFPCLTHSSRPKNRDTPGGVRNVLHLGALSVPSRIGGKRIIRTYSTVTRWFVIFRAHAWLLSSQFTVCPVFLCYHLYG